MPHSALIGIVNITPDSFSDGGNAFAPNDALAHCAKLVAEGADILDLGAESTRPGATPLTHAQEWERLEPVLSRIGEENWRSKVRISIDTRHAETASKALSLDADIINDVSGLSDTAMAEVLAKSECPIMVMHALTIPADKSVVLAEDVDVVAYIRNWAQETASRAEACGISKSRLIFDPGLGFGKNAVQSLRLLTSLSSYADAPENWLIGHSRKSLFNAIEEMDSKGRDSLTLCASSFLMAQNVGYLRVHNVARHATLRDALS